MLGKTDLEALPGFANRNGKDNKHWKPGAVLKTSEHPQTQNEVSWVLQLFCTSESQLPIFNGERQNSLWGYSTI